jgi:hypothetical protein
MLSTQTQNLTKTLKTVKLPSHNVVQQAKNSGEANNGEGEDTDEHDGHHRLSKSWWVWQSIPEQQDRREVTTKGRLEKQIFCAQFWIEE